MYYYYLLLFRVWCVLLAVWMFLFVPVPDFSVDPRVCSLGHVMFWEKGVVV
jgi:hypothetical protein